MTFFSDLLTSLFQRSSQWLPYQRANGDLYTLSKELLSVKGEVSGVAIARQILDSYRQLSDDEKSAFFIYLVDDMDFDNDALKAALVAYNQNRTPKNYAHLNGLMVSSRQVFFNRLHEAPNATYDLVCMRQDVLALMQTNDKLAVIDIDLRCLFTSWFNRGFLVLRPISWASPADILEKIISYEAVHEISSWEDLRRRLAPDDRCCFAFFHPAMPDEPLIFVEVALSAQIAGSIHDILSTDRTPMNPEDMDYAVFYSISNCQKGLAGISFGNSLIKTVVAELAKTYPQIKHFITLSPLPNFAKWLTAESQEQADNFDNLPTDEQTGLAASYLLNGKRNDNMPIDPVARFHLSNGAKIHQIHTKADLSKRGISQSFGVMVNYLYQPKELIENHENFVSNGKINAASKIKDMARKISR